MSIAFSVVDWIHVFTVVSKAHIAVYNVSNTTAIDFIDHGELYTYRHVDSKKVQFHMAANRIRLGTHDDPKMIPSATKNGCTLINWKGIRIAIVTSSVPLDLETDILIIANNSRKSIPGVKCKKIIIDSSNSFYLAERLLKARTLPGVEVYSVAHGGAFQMSF